MFRYFCKNPNPVYSRSVSKSVIYVSKIARNGDSFTVSCLMNSFGFSPESALSVAKKVQFRTPRRPESVIDFFKNHGFSNAQIRKLVAKRPQFLLTNPEKTLLPKFEFFYSKGIPSSNLAKVMSLRPTLLACSLHNRIIPGFNFFKDVTRCDDDKVLVAYKRCQYVLENDFQSLVAPNLAVLRECGVPECNMLRLLVQHPTLFVASNERFKGIVEEVKNLGFNPLKHYFLSAVRLFYQISKSKREKKLNVLKDYGWSDEEIVLAFARFPDFLGCSVHKIKSTMDYYVNTIGLKSSYIANSPCLLGYSLEKRIIPRFEVCQVLLSKGLIKKISIRTLMNRTEKDFLQMFVIPYRYLDLLKLYEEKLGNSK